MLSNFCILVLVLYGLCPSACFSTCGFHFSFKEVEDIEIYSLEQRTTINIIPSIGPLQCEKTCLLYRSCRSTIYSRKQLTCVLLTTINATDEGIQISLGACDGHTCDNLEQCIPLKSGSAFCVSYAKEGDVKLVNGTSYNEGRVEIYHDNIWGTICANDNWHRAEAVTTCRQIGYSYGIPIPNPIFGEGQDQIWYDNFQCAEEVSLTTCTYMHNRGCSHAHDAGVICSDDIISDAKAPIRLTAGVTPLDGGVEIFFAGYWGNLCGRLNSVYGANTVCQQLGYSHGTPMELPVTQKDLIWRVRPYCKSTKNYLTDCSFAKDWGEQPCNSGYRTSVICLESVNGTQDNITNFPVRLMNGNTSYEGRVEIYYHGYWGTVCQEMWTHANARVICRQYNSTDGFAVSRIVFGAASPDHPVWLHNVECAGDEDHISQCTFGIGQAAGYCLQRVLHAGVICKNPLDDGSTAQGTVRLTDGDSPSDGRVEVYIHGYWTTACRKNWDGLDAIVACRQLGYHDGTAVYDGRYGWGTGHSILGALACNGSEYELMNCSYHHDFACPSMMNAGAVCAHNLTDGDVIGGHVRLTGDSSDTATYGRLEIYYGGYWGSVCDSNIWTDEQAAVVCRQLGQSGGRALHRAFFGMGSDPIWMNNVKCEGTATMLADCSYDRDGSCPEMWQFSRHFLDISVVCGSIEEGQEPYGDLRLVNGSTSSEGIVQIYGRTGYAAVCTQTRYQHNVARVACRQLGYNPSNSTNFEIIVNGTIEAWISFILCNGEETRLDHCNFGGWKLILECNKETYFGVTCGN